MEAIDPAIEASIWAQTEPPGEPPRKKNSGKSARRPLVKGGREKQQDRQTLTEADKASLSKEKVFQGQSRGVTVGLWMRKAFRAARNASPVCCKNTDEWKKQKKPKPAGF